MLRQFLALSSALVLTVSALPKTPEAASGKASGFTFSVEKSGSTAVITGFEGSGSELVIPSVADGCTVTGIAENLFSGMDCITAVTIPDTVEKIGARSFSACPNLSTVTIGSGLTEIGSYAFSACPELDSFTVNSKNPTYTAADGCLCCGNSLLIYAGDDDADVPDGITSVGKAAFLGKTKMYAVTMPNTVKSLGDYAFSGCTSLKKVIIPDSISEMGTACFLSCSKLTTVCLGSGLTSISDDCFNACTSLYSVTIPENITETGKNAFFGCEGISGIYIPESVKKIGENAFGMHYSLVDGKTEGFSEFSLSGEIGSVAEKYAGEANFSFGGLTVGDVNSDGAVDGTDATLTLKEYALFSGGTDGCLSSYGRTAADLDGNNAVDGSDATLILKEYSRLSAFIPEI